MAQDRCIIGKTLSLNFEDRDLHCFRYVYHLPQWWGHLSSFV